VINLTKLSVGELVKRHLLIFAPLYILKLRQNLKRTKTPGKRKHLAVELTKIYGEIGEALKREKEAGNMTEVDENKMVNEAFPKLQFWDRLEYNGTLAREDIRKI
jgi:hypothetical protein